jgi:hypothetical protein
VRDAVDPITFSWTGPNGFESNADSLTNVLEGEYCLTVTDALGCTNTLCTTVNALSGNLDVTLTSTPLSCAASNNGTVASNVTGGTPSYSYAWTGPNGFTSNDANLSGLADGEYCATVTDAIGCFITECVLVDTLPSDLEVSLTSNAANCPNSNDGSVTSNVSGGVAPYTYAWSGPNGFTSDAENISNASSGEYCLNVTDAVGCTFDVCATIDVLPSSIEITLSSTPLNCPNSLDGAVSSVVSGGASPYTFSWAGPNGYASSSENIAGLEAGEYCLTATDALGCFNTECVTVDVAPSAITIDLTATPLACPNSSDGAINAIAGSGNEPYSFEWTGPDGFTSVNENIAGLASGEYCLTATDALGCQSTDCVNVGVSPSSITIDLTPTSLTCPNSNDGAIDATVGNGNAPYSFEWSGPDGFTSLNEDITGLVAGEYCITVTDALGCESTVCVNVGVSPSAITIDLTSTPLTCPNSNDGAINSVVGGGNAPYTLSWTGPDGYTSVNENISALASGEYCLTATDVFGCQNTSCVEVEIAPSSIQILLTAQPLNFWGQLALQF